jgi:hypothetical protein
MYELLGLGLYGFTMAHFREKRDNSKIKKKNKQKKNKKIKIKK